MKPVIHILHLEDEPADAELVQAILAESGLACRISRVQTRSEFESALRNGDTDIILADYRLPEYDGMSALRLSRELYSDIPFIFLSGTIGEEVAIACLTQGAIDYVYKQNLSRLSSSVNRALQEARNARERKQVEEALRRSEKEKTILNQIANIFLSTPDQEVYGEVLAVILQEMKSKFGLFGYIDQTGNLVIPSLTRDIWQECRIPGKSIVFPSDTWGNNLWGRSIREKRAFCSDGPFYTPDGHIPIDHFLAVPIVYQNDTIGLISVANSPKSYSEEDNDILRSIAEYISPILNARMQRDRNEQKHKRLEAQLNQMEKMESLGRLAGGVAHDLNNMLSVIGGFTEMALEQLGPDQPLYDDLLEVWKATERSISLIRQLLAFSRKQSIAPHVIDLNRIIEAMLRMLRSLTGDDINLTWLPGSEVWPVKVDPSQIDQILTNLCVNARDAIAGVGMVTIETGNITLDEAYCHNHPDFVAGEYVLLAVSDNGHGMDKETQDKIFEPFFTTKEVGKGTGLGLATVYGIVKQNNGFINVNSKPEHGTTFKIYLPRESAITEPLCKEKPDVLDDSGQEIILIAEDNPPSLEIVKRIAGGFYDGVPDKKENLI
ncbi:MAG: ATP-binding protein [Pseudomonadota bacterium]